jgi:hypothetical protein
MAAWLHENKIGTLTSNGQPGNGFMSPALQPDAQGTASELEASIEQAIAACGGDMRSRIRALIIANDYLETEVSELMKAVSRAYVRGRFHTYSG